MAGHKTKKPGMYVGINMPELKNSFKTLLANIRFASIDREIKSIAIVAAGVNEGKTTVSLNLATAIGASGKKVLLVEGDMRKRSLARSFDIHSKHGVYGVMSGKCLPQDAVVPSGVENVDLLDCEPNIPAPPDLLSTSRFNQLIHYYSKMYDTVIIDTPPLSSFVDGALIANRVDATILVVREGKAKRTEVENVIKQLKTAQANLLGTVLTFSTNSAENEYYYAYYNKENKRVKKGKGFDSGPKVSEAKQKQNLQSWLDPSLSGGFTPVQNNGPAHGVIEQTQENSPINGDQSQNTAPQQYGQQGAHYNNPSVADSSPFEAV